jgi:tyrosyl-tRNA synthetase
MPRSVFEELEARGLIHDSTSREELGKMLAGETIAFYIGYDPTALSLHLGTLVPIVTMARLQKAGHKPIVLIGGATGMIGDPSGKSEERQLLDTDTLAANVAAVRAQLSRFLTFGDGPSDAVIVNNADWFEPISYIGFLRDIGKHLTINYMMAKESVRARLSDREQGISYTEFSYMLLQAYDFVHLAGEHGCKLQLGGSDQWGNITAGIELGRKMAGHHLHGVTMPLILDASGQKMGKTSSGTRIWLDPKMTSPYALYQYLLNVADDDVERFLKIFSWRRLEEIAEITTEHAKEPHKRLGQKALAEDVTTWVHGADALKRATAASQVMFGGSLDELSDEDLEPLLADVPSSEIDRSELSAGIELLELLQRTKLAKSKGEARRLVTGGGVYVNNVRAEGPEQVLSEAHLGTETMLVLRSGKKKYHIVRSR